MDLASASHPPLFIGMCVSHCPIPWSNRVIFALMVKSQLIVIAEFTGRPMIESISINGKSIGD